MSSADIKSEAGDAGPASAARDLIEEEESAGEAIAAGEVLSPAPIIGGLQESSSRRRGRLPKRLTHIHRHGAALWGASSQNLRASLLMVASILTFSIMMAGFKQIGDRVPLAEVLLIRQLVITAFLMPMFAKGLRPAFATSCLRLQFVRGGFSLAAQLSYFVVLLHMPFAEMTALGFGQVIFQTGAAWLILGETVGWRRWTATLVGFVGVLIMIKPGADGIDIWALLAIASALLTCAVSITIRLMPRHESPATIMLYQTLVLTPAYAIMTAANWVWPSPADWALLLFIGLVGALAQYLYTHASQMGEAAAMAPLEFTRLMFAVLIGYFLFAETPELSTMIGAVVVIGATVYTVRRNAR